MLLLAAEAAPSDNIVDVLDSLSSAVVFEVQPITSQPSEPLPGMSEVEDVVKSLDDISKDLNGGAMTRSW